MECQQSSAYEKIHTESGSKFGPVLVFIFLKWIHTFGERSQH